MNRVFRRLIARLPGARTLLERYSAYKAKRRLNRYRSAEDIFTEYYHSRHWSGGGEETVSGAGSTVAGTQKLRQEIQSLLHDLNVAKLLDAPCGDYNWFRLIPRGAGQSYLGADVVAPLVAENNRKYANENTSFVHLDITRDALPDADLWICRECLFHFSDEDIFRTVDNLLRSNVRYFLTTTHPNTKQNTDIPTGHFRPLNLEIPPFSFPTPLLYIDDGMTDRPDAKLALWEREELAAALALNEDHRVHGPYPLHEDRIDLCTA